MNTKETKDEQARMAKGEGVTKYFEQVDNLIDIILENEVDWPKSLEVCDALSGMSSTLQQLDKHIKETTQELSLSINRSRGDGSREGINLRNGSAAKINALKDVQKILDRLIGDSHD